MPSNGSIGFFIQNVPDAFRDRARLRKWLRSVATSHGSRVDAVNFVLMDERALLHYNTTFLHHDDHTDVITFPVDNNNGVAGDILMSYPRIKENARTFGVTAQQELRRVMVHGLLHLLGHRDKTMDEQVSMREQEDRFLDRFPKR